MSGELSRLGSTGGLDRVHGRGNVTPRIQRAVEQAVALEHGRAIIQAARVRGVDYVGTEAMQTVAGITDLETLYLQRSPLGEGRFKLIADTVTCAVAGIVAETGRS